MRAAFTQDQDPADWCAVLAVFFLALVWWRLGVPNKIYFDELHYVEAARHMIAGQRYNPEHPMLAKRIIAWSIELLGDKPLHWRLPSAVAGAIGLYAFARLVWFATGRRLATIAAMLLLASDFSWFIQSRIAMLDMIMACFGMIGLWQVAAAIRLTHQGRWRLAIAGLAFGLALGSKWSIAPVLLLPGMLFIALRLRHFGSRFLLVRQGGPVTGISLIEAGVWLGLLPLLVYWLTFWPAFHWVPSPVDPWDPLGWHRQMLELQDSVRKLHQYRSVWYEWVGNTRAIWYLYEPIDGVQRGIVLIGNPFTMLAGLPALAWACWAGLRCGRHDALAFALLYGATLGLWIVSSKPIQFYYHYLLPAAFLMACLALALDELWRRVDRWRWLAPGAMLIAGSVFFHFYPIISAAPLCCGRMSYSYWMWLYGWR